MRSWRFAQHYHSTAIGRVPPRCREINSSIRWCAETSDIPKCLLRPLKDRWRDSTSAVEGRGVQRAPPSPPRVFHQLGSSRVCVTGSGVTMPLVAPQEIWLLRPRDLGVPPRYRAGQHRFCRSGDSLASTRNNLGRGVGFRSHANRVWSPVGRPRLTPNLAPGPGFEPGTTRLTVSFPCQ